MTIKRRHFLMFLGAGVGAYALNGLQHPFNPKFTGLGLSPANATGVGFTPIVGPMPAPAVNIAPEEQTTAYATYSVQDDIVLPEGYRYDVIAAWGDPVGDSWFGYNNDYLSFVRSGPRTGYLTVNFEYISSDTWLETYPAVMGVSLPAAEVAETMRQQAPLVEDAEEIDASSLPEDSLLKAQIRQLSKAALLDQGLGVIAIEQMEDGAWVRSPAAQDRRISGISGLEDGRYLNVTGPAAAVFTKSMVKGYSDGLGARIIGTFGNCAGGTTPWGTVLSAEENIQSQVPESVYGDGSAFAPAANPFHVSISGQGNVFGLAGNKYGWIVEVNPADPNDYGTKHSWLGRYRHEAVGIRAEAGKPLAFYSGCDRRGGHLYKFISAGTVTQPTDPANSQLLADGMLYAAKFNADGTGQWIPLQASTPVNPVRPSQVAGGMVTLPKRPDGGFEKVEQDSIVDGFMAQFQTLGDLYSGNEIEQQGAILIDAHYAANAIGATATARPEDTYIGPNGQLFIAFTSGMSGGDGGPDLAIFQGPNGETEYEAGWIMKLTESANEPAALTFSWEMFAAGGEPADGGFGFANPDNLEFDPQGNLWVVTDMSTGTHNQAVPNRINAETGEPIVGKDLLGLYGNNSLWKIETTGDRAGEAKMFAYGPMDSELTGPFFTDDGTTLFVAAQHPGERNGTRMAMSSEERPFALQTTTGEEFMQTRTVPLGSNWPALTEGAPPRPAVVAIRRIDNGTIT